MAQLSVTILLGWTGGGCSAWTEEKLPRDSKNWYRAENGGKVLNHQNLVDWVAGCSHVSGYLNWWTMKESR